MKDNYFNKIEKFHFVGIGGAGMNPIAQILLKMGYKVSGSDIRRTNILEYLEKLGAKIYIGHHENNISNDIDVVVYSSAVNPENNPEIIKAKKLRIPIIKRSVMLAELSRTKKGIAIAGTHGKTTTTYMLGKILTDANIDPTIIVGGIIKNTNTGARWGESPYIVMEADEYDKSFLYLSPIYEIITNIEPDHLECYGSFENIKKAFIEFANKVPFYGKVAVCIDESTIQEILPYIESPIITYSTTLSSSDIYAKNITIENGFSSFEVIYHGKNLGKVQLSIPGIHNIRNSLGAIAISLELDVNFEIIKKSLSEFSNVKRRFEIIYEDENVILIDDYAHHPTEIKATLNAAKELKKDYKIVAIFQPHLYSRTLNFSTQFAESLKDADIIVITEIYAARETPIEGVSAEIIVAKLKEMGLGDKVFYIQDKEDIPEFIFDKINIDEKYLIISLGAGDINKYLYEIKEGLGDAQKRV